MKLWFSDGSPFARKVRIVLAEKGLSYEKDARSGLRPAENFVHLRTTNPIESTFATIRHRTKQVNGAFSQETLMAVMFKLAIAAEQSFRRIKGFDWLAEVIRGVQFIDGVRKQDQDQQRQAAAW